MPDKVRTSPNLRVAQSIAIKSGSQTFLQCTSKETGLFMVQIYGNLYEKHNLVATNSYVQVEVDKPSKLLIANFGTYPVQVNKNRVVAQLLLSPTTVTQGLFTVGKVLIILDRNSKKQNPNPNRENKKTAGSGESLKRKRKMPRIKKKRNSDLLHWSIRFVEE